MRLDKFLQTEYNLKSRTYAENLIKTSRVMVDGGIVLKTSFDVNESMSVEILQDENFASQGAYKLSAALDIFKIDVRNKSAADIGCSNGGFTDVLLRGGVASVIAVDVAECALSEDLLNDGRVRFLRANARELLPLDTVDFVCSDVSFISLKYILKSVYNLLKSDGRAVLLIKPQFELDRSALNKGGIVTREEDRQRAVSEVQNCALACGFRIEGTAVSPIRYQDKNIEYLLYISKMT